MASVNRGFTLIEMLVSMVILSSTIMLATQAYRQFNVDSHSFTRKYQTKTQDIQVTQLTRERLQYSLLYFSSKNSDFFSNKTFPFWIGLPKELIAITKHSMQEPQRSAIYKMKMEENGTVSYCESLIDSTVPYVNVIPGDICDFSVVVATGVSDLKFRYYGWSSDFDMAIAKSNDSTLGISEGRKWFNHYVGETRGLMPEWLEVTLEYDNGPMDVWLFSIKGQAPEKLKANTIVEG